MIYDKNADQLLIQSRYGKVYWDYATSMNTFNESYLIAPMLKNNNVVSYVEVKRLKNKIFFGFIENENIVNNFFNTIIFTNKINLTIPTLLQNKSDNFENSTKATRILECKTVTKTFIVGYVEGGGLNQGDPIESTTTETVCKFVDGPADQDQCLTDYDATGNCNGGGGNGGGGGYPYTPELEVDCENASKTINNPAFKAKFIELNTSPNLGLDYEVGSYKFSLL